jgi:hypothetical protein
MSGGKDYYMAAVVVEIIDVQSLFGQEVLNVFHFVDPTGAGTAATLISDYVAHSQNLMKVAQNSLLTHTAIRYRTVYPTASLMLTSTAGLPVAGGDVNTPTDSATAFSFQFFLDTTTVLAGGFTGHIKRGGCRVAGCSSGDMNANTPPGGAIATDFAAWIVTLMNPNAGLFHLCVASFLNGARVRQHTVQSYALVTGASPPSFSTQNTRKVLRGRTS